MACKRKCKLPMRISFPHLTLSLCVDNEHQRTSSDLHLFLASELTSPASSARTESKFRLRVADAETNPRHDELDTHMMERSSSYCTEHEQRSERKMHLEPKCWRLWLKDRDPKIEILIGKRTKLGRGGIQPQTHFCMWVYPLTCGTEPNSSSGVIFAIWAELFSKTMPKKYSYISAELESIIQAPQGLNNPYILYSLFLKYLLLHS